ncbi:MAG TPA: lipoyl(octanoyl) transferase LipB [Stenomitos sp.]
MSTGTPLHIIDLGRRPYDEVYALQKRLVEERAEDRIGDTLLLVEHDRVITLGRKGDPTVDVLMPGIPVFEIERGGEATYHAPGQLVGYPILKLEEGPERDLHRLLRNIEEVQIRTLARWGVEAGRKEGYTGVWVGDKKISSIGIAVRRWVTYHGLGLNVGTDMRGFASIRPCGLTADVMTSLEALVGHPVRMDEVKAELVKQFGEVFHRSVVPGRLPAEIGP